jgi:hypothetical protein
MLVKRYSCSSQACNLLCAELLGSWQSAQKMRRRAMHDSSHASQLPLAAAALARCSAELLLAAGTAPMCWQDRNQSPETSPTVRHS